jgi:uncharacterized protein (DUF1501 family)
MSATGRRATPRAVVAALAAGVRRDPLVADPVPALQVPSPDVPPVEGPLAVPFTGPAEPFPGEAVAAPARPADDLPADVALAGGTAPTDGTAPDGTIAPGGTTPAAALAAGSRSLVVVFLRGGADGLSLLPPLSEPRYGTARPGIGVPAAAARPLLGPAADRRFGLHPAMARIAALYAGGRVAIVPACGQLTSVRSHFEDQSTMEAAGGTPTGWAGRYLAAAVPADDPFRAVAIGAGLPGSLRGYPAATGTGLESFALPSWSPPLSSIAAQVRGTYGRAGGHPLLHAWAEPALAAAGRIAPLAAESPPADWPTGPAAGPLWAVARLLRAGVPVRVAHVDVGGWDTHESMGAATDPNGLMHRNVAALDAALGAFLDVLGPAASTTTVVVMTEFGRRLNQNGSGGLDHGRAFPMLVLGPGAAAGVHGPWPGLTTLDGGDLSVATDYRHVLAELLGRWLSAPAAAVAAAFPGSGTSAAHWVGVCR